MTVKKEKKEKKIELNIIQILEQIGKVQIIDENLLIFTGDDNREVYLRYSIGEVFSFLKGSLPIKIQVRKGYDTDVEKFKEKLVKIIDEEIENGSNVRELHLGSIYLVQQMEHFNNNEMLKKYNISFAEKNMKLEHDGVYYKISVNHKKEVLYSFTNHFLAIKNDIGATLDITVNLSREIEEVKKHILV